jgi:hypothetical protein
MARCKCCSVERRCTPGVTLLATYRQTLPMTAAHDSAETARQFSENGFEHNISYWEQ